MTAHLIRMAAIESEVESLRSQVAGLTAELEAASGVRQMLVQALSDLHLITSGRVRDCNEAAR